MSATNKEPTTNESNWIKFKRVKYEIIATVIGKYLNK